MVEPVHVPGQDWYVHKDDCTMPSGLRIAVQIEQFFVGEEGRGEKLSVFNKVYNCKV